MTKMKNGKMRDESYFSKRYNDLPLEMKTLIYHSLGKHHMKWQYYRNNKNPKFMVWWNHTKNCHKRDKEWFDTPYGRRFKCSTKKNQHFIIKKIDGKMIKFYRLGKK